MINLSFISIVPFTVSEFFNEKLDSLIPFIPFNAPLSETGERILSFPPPSITTVPLISTVSAALISTVPLISTVSAVLISTVPFTATVSSDGMFSFRIPVPTLIIPSLPHASAIFSVYKTYLAFTSSIPSAA